jgi:hypothetical protein
MAMGNSDLPRGGARARALERDHVGIIAMRTSPDLQIEIGEQHSLLVGDADHVQVRAISQCGEKVDRAPNYRVMVAGQQHHRQACTSNDAAGTVEKIGRYAVAIERIARKQNHIGPMLVCRAQDRR